MNLAVDRISLKCAQEVFKALGMAISFIHTYTDNHPRYREAIGRVAGLIQEYFQGNPELQNMTFILNGQRAEFRKIPLLSVGSHGSTLIKALSSRGLGGLQVQRGMAAQDVGDLIRSLLACPTRSRSDLEAEGKGQSPALSPPQSPPGPEGKPLYELISAASAAMMKMDWKTCPAEEEVGEGSFQIPEFQVFEDTARSLLTTYRTLLSQSDETMSLNHESLKSTVDQVMALMPSKHDRFVTATSSDYFDDFTFHHSVNVCLITTMVASMILKDQEMIRRISLAALLHDVGKSRIPEEILHKPGKLTPAEFQCMQKHPLIGAEILLGVEKIDPLCVTLAFGHHLPHGTAPYPQTRKPYQYDWITRLISVVDVYEALTAVRPYKKGLSSETAFRVMLSMPGLENNIEIVKLLYDCLGPYPAGAVVELNTGERAVVVEQNSNRHLPKVRVFTDSQRNPLAFPFDLDLSAPRERPSLKGPLKIARTVVRQSQSESLWQNEWIPEPTDILGAPLHDDHNLMVREG